MSKATADELRLLIRSGWRLVVLETFEEDRALALLEKVAGANEAPLVRWSLAGGLAANVKTAGSLEAGLRALETHTGAAIFALLDVHRLLDDPLAVRRLRDLLPGLAAKQQAIVLVTPMLELPVELIREAGRVELPLPNASELHALFERALDKTPKRDPEALAEAVRAALGLTANEAVRVLRRACRVAGALDEKAVQEIVREKRRALRRTPALAFHEASADLAQIGGLSELKRWLVERRRAFGDEARQFGLPTPKGLLLFGVQGCGKSLCAKAVAREWRFPLLRLDLASAFGGGAQTPEAAMREAIQVAESLAPAVLWIDEIEKGFAATHSDSRASRVFGSFLTWLSEKQTPVFVVATANDVAGLPPELLRRGRFDDLFFVDLPTAAERAEILAIHLRQRGRDPAHYRLEELAAQAERLTGAELEQAVIAGLFRAFEQSRELEEDDLVNALDETVALYDTYEERIKELRDWARVRARPASVDPKLVDLFARS
jgi:ATP-dependent 26S proteasome regulatory subunit